MHTYSSLCAPAPLFTPAPWSLSRGSGTWTRLEVGITSILERGKTPTRLSSLHFPVPTPTNWYSSKHAAEKYTQTVCSAYTLTVVLSRLQQYFDVLLYYNSYSGVPQRLSMSAATYSQYFLKMEHDIRLYTNNIVYEMLAPSMISTAVSLISQYCPLIVKRDSPPDHYNGGSRADL